MRLILLLLLSATAARAQESRLWTPLKTYTDTARGVSFRYPASWKPETEFGFAPGSLSMGESKPVAGFGIAMDADQTNIVDGNAFVEGFGIVYSAIPATNPAMCDTTARRVLDGQTSGKTKHIKLGEITYTTYDVSEIGMSQVTDGTLYTAFRKGTCFLFETDEASVGMAVFDEGDVKTRTAAAIKPRHSISSHLLDVMKSVRIR